MYCFSPNWKDKNDQCERLIQFFTDAQRGEIDLPNDFTHLSNLSALFMASWNINNEFMDNNIPKLV